MALTKRYPIVKFVEVLFLGLILLGLAIGWFIEVRGTQQGTIVSPDDSVKIESFRFCGISGSSSTGTEKARVCGSVISNKPSVPIDLFMYRMPGENTVVRNPVEDRFANGAFVRELALPSGQEPGHYEVVAYFYKQEIRSIVFDVPSP